MQSFRHVWSVISSAMAMIVAGVTLAVDLCLVAVLACSEFSAKAAKFKAVLLHNAHAKHVSSVQASSDLVADGHGYRQSTASPLMAQLTPAFP